MNASIFWNKNDNAAVCHQSPQFQRSQDRGGVCVAADDVTEIGSVDTLRPV